MFPLNLLRVFFQYSLLARNPNITGSGFGFVSVMPAIIAAANWPPIPIMRIAAKQTTRSAMVWVSMV
jgi:hypothetical protein